MLEVLKIVSDVQEKIFRTKFVQNYFVGFSRQDTPSRIMIFHQIVAGFCDSVIY